LILGRGIASTKFLKIFSGNKILKEGIHFKKVYFARPQGIRRRGRKQHIIFVLLRFRKFLQSQNFLGGRFKKAKTLWVRGRDVKIVL